MYQKLDVWFENKPSGNPAVERAKMAWRVMCYATVGTDLFHSFPGYYDSLTMTWDGEGDGGGEREREREQALGCLSFLF
jgi:hypothetical protein